MNHIEKLAEDIALEIAGKYSMVSKHIIGAENLENPHGELMRAIAKALNEFYPEVKK